MRGAAGAVLLPLAACSAEPASDPGSLIDCALEGAAEFARECAIAVDGREVTVRHPDGSFRRLTVIQGGIEAADGAEPAVVSSEEGVAQIAIGVDRYRFAEGLTFDAVR